MRATTLPHCVLRPTLMFGWFDRIHLGWLGRFLRRVPVFPVPGHGRYPRQPLYARDFCRVILSCIQAREQGAHDISGLEFIDYIDLIREVRAAVGSRALVVKLPFTLFDWLLKIWAMFDSDPPFTSAQLQALVAGDEFEIVDWASRFSVTPTPLPQAIQETFGHAEYGQVELKF